MTPFENRVKKTLRFVSETLEPGSIILDLGIPNKLGSELKAQGYEVNNTSGEDLDIDQSKLEEKFDAVTAFEILEHTLNPFGILKAIKSDRLFVSIPLRLWFSSAYCSESDPLDRHFHEFEDWQFDWLLEKTGWEIVRSEKWKSPVKKLGFRPILRMFTNRYYIVEARRTTR